MNNVKYNCNCNYNKKKAFTLIELLIVIAIIGILFIVLVSKVDFATDKAKATGVQTDFRSFQLAFNQVAQENAGFNSLGWDTGDENGDRIRNSYDKGDKECGQLGCTECKQDGVKGPHEVWVGSKTYGETWNEVCTLVNPTDNKDASAFVALENAINKNLDPKLHITITPDANNAGELTGNAVITMANQARDPWKNEYHGVYISHAERDHGADRGAIIMYSNGANGKWGSAHDITNGVVTVVVPGNNTYGKDDYSLVSCYTFVNGYGEVLNMSTGFSNNQSFMANGSNSTAVVPGGNGGSGNAGGNGGNEPDVNEPIPVVPIVTFNDGTTLTWEELQLSENGTKYGYKAASITNTSIADYAFRNCTGLTSVVIPDSVTSIGNQAFYNCYNLASVVIGDGVTTIGDYAFYKCTSLESLTIPGSVTSIGDDAFRLCSSLASIVIPDSVTSIGVEAFYKCTSLENVVIGDSVTSIGEETFAYCTNLTSVTFGNSVAVIGMYAFEGCDNLTSLTIPDSVTSIHNNAFQYCSNLTIVTIGNNVPNISPCAFRGCNSLTSVIIPDSVTVISSSAFEDCTSLTSITYHGTVSQWNAISKGNKWKYQVPATYVQCSNGQVNI